MELVELAALELTYTSLESLDFESEGRLYGAMEGRLSGERLSGALQLTNLAPRRADGVNLPTLRGVLRTDDGARVWVELDGIATLRETDGARVFVTSCRFRTGDARHGWLNHVLALVEGTLDVVGAGGRARGRVFECRPTFS